MSKLVLVRHGETVGESSIRFYGATDIVLSKHGEEQMKLVKQCLDGLCFDRVVTSSLKRSIDASRIILNSKKICRETVDDFAELNFGDWEGLTESEIARQYPAIYNVWKLRSLDFCYPHGDSRQEFTDRISTAAKMIFSSGHKHTLAVLHKGVIRIIIATLCDLSLEEVSSYRIELGSIHRLEKCNTHWKLISHNETDHLGSARIASGS